MTITRYHTGKKLSRIIEHCGIVYLCGQVALDYNGNIIQQTREVLARIDEHLAEAGTDKCHMLAVTIYVKHMNDIPAMNEIWCDWLKDCAPPTRSCICADMANDNILVEMTVTAAKLS